ncbi:MAG: rhodanese-like domain-containing protein [Candidatus Electrothrix aestuarii]|uniref:Rhodanese-like domain-containing protein n=1 Tax=Candidatus Electrothrix aestuarii TaxID=3062594 RepID=A0AAU8LWZ8_9BACT|nr:rhodanese-like domain-containing protein [Candidatus Electrothrix aestuarii]
MRKKIALLTLLFSALSVAGAWGKTASGVIMMDVNLSQHAQDKEVQLWLPYPESDDDQTISNIFMHGDYAEAKVYRDKVFNTPMLYARWDKDVTNRKLTLSFQAERKEVTRPEFPAKEADWNPEDFAKYLAPTKLAPLDGEVKKLSDEITKGKTTVLEKAKAIYDWTVENTFRDPETRGCGEGDVCKLLKRPGGKCADISSVYVALARAAGVPCREILGIRMGKKEVQDITSWQHCWAEFYLPGYGWVAIDPADVRKKMLVEKLELNDPKTEAYREYFWGGLDPFRVKLGEGRDLVLNPPQHGKPVNYLMYPFAQVGEDTLDWLAPAKFSYTISYHQIHQDGYALIDTASLKKLLDMEPADLLVVDARNPEEYEEVHIKGAINVPQKKFKKYADLLPKEKSARIIFYCNGIKCGKSRKAAKAALEMGYKRIFVYAEGMPVWEEAGMPIYAGPDYEKRIETDKLSPAELNTLIESKADTFTVVDVRDPEEFKKGHVPGAINIPSPTFASQSEVLDKDKQIIVYCSGGGRSYNAYRKLMKLGYKDIRQAIFFDWQEAGLPVEKSEE